MHPMPALPASDGGCENVNAKKFSDFQDRLNQAFHAGSSAALAKQRARGKATARERITALLDEDSFVELDALARHRSHAFGLASDRPYGDGVVAGHGTIHGRQVCVFSQDFTVFGGSLGEVFGEKVVKVMDLAMKVGCPIIGINDSGGARIQEGVVSLALYGEIIRRNVDASGVVPQISLLMGPCAGGAAYSPAITDFTVMVDGISHMVVTGPDVIRAVTGEESSVEELGGARLHNEVTGAAHYLALEEADAIDYARDLLGYLPSNNCDDPPSYPETSELALTARDRELDSLLPASPFDPFDIREVIVRVLDDGEFLEVQALFARNLIVGFGRIDGRTIGVVANQSTVIAGALDIDASEKASRFVRFCDSFNIPILTLVDTPGALPGVVQEHNAIIRRGAKMGYAYAECTVPLVTVIVRKAYGGGYGVMGSKHLGADINFAWPTAEIAVLGPTSAIKILYRGELRQAEDPRALQKRLTEQYEQTMCNPYTAADRGYVDAVIMPAETRKQLIRAFRMLRGKRRERMPRKHGNMPL